MIQRQNLVGKKFGRLQVTAFSHIGARRKPHWMCLCDCGAIKVVRGDCLKSGNTKGCGCVNRDWMQTLGRERYVHGEAKVTSEYNTWASMKQRCGDPNNSHYKYYGGRGIRVCEQWQHSFGAFLLDMGRKPSKGHSIDRIDDDGNYEPTNCRWATVTQQANNRHRRNYLELFKNSEPLQGSTNIQV